MRIARRAHPTQRSAEGAAEQDPAGWWRAVVAAVRALGPERDRVVAVCPVGQGPTLVVVDPAGRAVRPAITWMDTRPARHVATDGPDRIAGFTIQPAIAWLARREPKSLERAAWLLNSWEWLAFRLSGVGGPAAIGQDLGPLTEAAAEALGVPRSARVIAGTNDGAATMVGAGLQEPGDAVDVGGASGGLAVLADAPLDLPGIYCAPSLLPDRWILGGAMAAIGSSLDWLQVRVLGGRVPYRQLFEDAAAVEPGAAALVFLPYLAGERSPIWDDRARGAFVGLHLDHGRGHLVRAVLEGGAFAMRAVAEPIAQAGRPVRQLRLSGRPATSAVWAQIKADVLGVPMVVPPVLEAGALGAATLAAVGTGLYASLDDAIQTMRGEGSRINPRPEFRETYDALFGVYRRLYPALRPTFRALQRVGPTARAADFHP